MCGVFSILNASVSLPPDELKALTSSLLRASETRGSEASGSAMWRNGTLTVRKSQSAASRFVRSKGFRELFLGQDGFATCVVIGHSRMVTNGSAIYDVNNQPAEAQGVCLVHNGIITNFEVLAESGDRRESDTAVAASFLARLQASIGVVPAVQEFFSILNGSATISLLSTSESKLVAATNTGSLYVAAKADGSIAFLGSEQRIVEAVIADQPSLLRSELEVSKIAPGSGIVIDTTTGEAAPISLGGYVVAKDRHFKGVTKVKSGDAPMRAPQPPAPSAGARSSQLSARRFAESVRRCTRCILPETFPFISFDADGVCRQCAQYRQIVTKPFDSVRALLPPPSKSPNCIVAFSGGRDSSYGLHLLVRELGMNPITLTYDWGMVTDLARRNQAKMTGTLGVENILISANIARKRRNIGLNLRAWIKRPHLGMTPLLMAGDKQFFLHAQTLSRATGIPLVIFCINPLEMTFFKSGFAGVPDQRYYTSSSAKSRLQLLRFYANQYAHNPSYFNRSLWDTVEATYATYARPHDYLQLFEWVAWDEDHINELLVTEYDWETDPTTTTTWRIGDGTAPFYNWVYWRTVAFTENDTFRSNQVREGQISRDRALELALSENEPRWQRIDEYLSLVGVETGEALDAVERLAQSLGR